jgi:hypothetical protein
MLFKNSVRTSKRTPLFTITTINWLTLFKFNYGNFSFGRSEGPGLLYSGGEKLFPWGGVCCKSDTAQPTGCPHIQPRVPRHTCEVGHWQDVRLAVEKPSKGGFQAVAWSSQQRWLLARPAAFYSRNLPSNVAGHSETASDCSNMIQDYFCSPALFH